VSFNVSKGTTVPMTFALAPVVAAAPLLAGPSWHFEGPTVAIGSPANAHVNFRVDPTALGEVVSLNLLQDEDAAGQPAATTAAEDAGEPVSARARKSRFGEADTWRLNVLAWYANNFDESEIQAGAVSFSYFMVDDVSIDFEFSLLNVDQEGPNAWGGNINLLLRWHVVSQPTWSFYFDAGAGFLKTNDDVPDNGSSWNFTPQAGVGFTLDVGYDWRAMAGVRWHHISNADLNDSNPGRDSLQVYAGLSVPF